MSHQFRAICAEWRRIMLLFGDDELHFGCECVDICFNFGLAASAMDGEGGGEEEEWERWMTKRLS